MLPSIGGNSAGYSAIDIINRGSKTGSTNRPCRGGNVSRAIEINKIIGSGSRIDPKLDGFDIRADVTGSNIIAGAIKSQS